MTINPIDWVFVGEREVKNAWYIAQNNTRGTLFKITTIINSQPDWDLWKFKSGAYLQFFDNYTKAFSPPRYIKVREEPVIIEVPFPQALIALGVYAREIRFRRAVSPRYNVTPSDTNFASWSLRIESDL